MFVKLGKDFILDYSCYRNIEIIWLIEEGDIVKYY